MDNQTITLVQNALLPDGVTDVLKSMPGATVYIYEADGATLATIYNKAGSPISNPMTTDSNGSINFSAPNGFYLGYTPTTPPSPQFPIRMIDPTSIVSD